MQANFSEALISRVVLPSFILVFTFSPFNLGTPLNSHSPAQKVVADAEIDPQRPPANQAGDRICGNLSDGTPFAQTELFFGLSKPDGSAVSDKQFQQFVAKEVSPRFPDGLTLLSGIGQFRDGDGKIVREGSRLLILLYPITDSSSHRKIDRIRALYKSTFQQESVLRTDEQTCISF
jgi:hypothetical protein